jgi:hypothetical protein
MEVSPNYTTNLSVDTEALKTPLSLEFQFSIILIFLHILIFLRQKHRLRLYKNRLQGRKFWPKRDEVKEH